MTDGGRGIVVVTAQTAEGERNNRKFSSLTGLQNLIPQEAEGEVSVIINHVLFEMSQIMKKVLVQCLFKCYKGQFFYYY